MGFFFTKKDCCVHVLFRDLLYRTCTECREVTHAVIGQASSDVILPYGICIEGIESIKNVIRNTNLSNYQLKAKFGFYLEQKCNGEIEVDNSVNSQRNQLILERERGM